MDAHRHVLHVFLSSTAIDLTAYRETARDAILRLQKLPVTMETFTAMPGEPASACRAKAAAADAVVVLVAHRYGCVPPPDLGGDGQRSITWLEVEAARDAGKPVFAFLVDPQAPWHQAKEQDRLVNEPEKAQEVFAAVQQLQEFRKYLQANCTYKTFTSADNLDALVTAALANYADAAGPTAALRAREWHPQVCHALQPAPHFQGRAALREGLVTWVRAPVTPDRVVSLVAAGGTGKTALAERVLADLGGKVPAGLLVWSFYEDLRTEEFLRVACEYFGGATDVPAGGRLERLQQALAGDLAHLLVLDGLERVQAAGLDSRPRGTLEDPQLKRLLRYLVGGPGRARALVTSRFPLVDLEAWVGAGHRAERLDDLDALAARALLQAWGVRGENTALDAVAGAVHGHALTLAVLGSYLGHFCGGDPAKAPTFDRNEAAADDPKAARLGRVLGEYAQALGGAERDLLVRLSVFTRGVSVAALGFLVAAGGKVAGALVGCAEARLVQLLERLRRLGLVFAYSSGSEVTYTAHPFLRGYFQALLGVPAAEVHEAVRARLATSLDARPDTKPTEPVLLDRYEGLIEHTRLAGRVQEAFDLYLDGLAGYEHLGTVLGESARGLRIVTGFSTDGTIEKIAPNLRDSPRADLATGWGLYTRNLGDLEAARRAFEFGLAIRRQRGDAMYGSRALQNLCEVELLAGRLPRAHESAWMALAEAQRAHHHGYQTSSYGYLAASLAALGDVVGAKEHFRTATRFEGQPLYSLRGLKEAEFRMACGDAAGARRQTQANWEVCQDYGWVREVALCDTVLGRLLLPDDPTEARRHLDAARDFGARSGEVEIQLRAYQLAADLARHLGDLPTVAAEAEAGVLLAGGCGFGLYAIDLRLALARVHLEAGDARDALRLAREALDRAAAPECRYAWGEADALDLAGRTHARLGEPELAQQRLTAAVAARERLGHLRPADTSSVGWRV